MCNIELSSHPVYDKLYPIQSFLISDCLIPQELNHIFAYIYLATL